MTTTYKTLPCRNEEDQNPYFCCHKNLKSTCVFVEFYKEILFGMKAQMYLAFYTLHTWLSIALSLFTSNSFVHCDQCPVRQFVHELWDIALSIFFSYTRVPSMLLCIDSLLHNSWPNIVLNWAELQLCYLYLVLILFSYLAKNWHHHHHLTCGRKFCGAISFFLVLLGTVPINNLVNHPLPCGTSIYALQQDSPSLFVLFHIWRIS